MVVDSFSSDTTLEICQKFGAKIIQHEYITSARQKNWAIPQCKNEWVLQVDSDEILEDDLIGEIKTVLTRPPENISAFKIPFKHHVIGKSMKHAGIYPSYIIRLFKRDLGRFTDREVHAYINLPLEETGVLKNHILHFGMPNISKQLANLNRYTRYEADELAKQGRPFSAYRMLLHPWVVFAYRFFWQQGFRDGWRGLIFCAYTAIYTFLVWAKRWEMQEQGLDSSPK
jgi:glycosyltransferase involved in cell wall biosynthesis